MAKRGGQIEVLNALDKAKTQWYHFTAIIISGMGFFTDAYDLFCITTVTKLLGRIYYYDPTTGKPGSLPPNVSAAVNGVALCGTFAGQLFFGWLGDKLGRKKVYGMTLMTMVISAIASGLSFGHTAKSVMTTLCFFRFWLGFGVGGDYPLSATIMSEYANKRTRGAFVAAVFAMQGFGILTGGAVSIIVAAAFNHAFHRPTFEEDPVLSTAPQADFVWRIILMFGAVPALLTYYWRLKMPETARYTALVAKNTKQAATDMAKVLQVDIEQPSAENQRTTGNDERNSTARILRGVRMVCLQQFSARLWAVALSHCCSCRIRMVPTLYLNVKYGGLTVKQGHLRNISSAVCIPHYHSPLNCITYSIKHFTPFSKKQNLSCLQHCFSLSSTSLMQHDAENDDYRSGGALVSAVRKGLGHMNIFCKEYSPGQYNHIVCPQCQGGQSREKSLSLNIGKDGVSAKWICFRAKCGWTGSFKIAGMSVGSSARELENLAFQNAISFDEAADVISDVEVTALKDFTEENLRLEQISDQDLCDYFASRKISRETLQRNGVMQTRRNNKIVIAFTYRKDGKIVNCKYRDAKKHFWQEKHGQKIPYGLDDIKEARDIIIVEGEFDKLSMEEAGYRNCISVPNGAPPKVSTKELPPVEQDKRYEFLWNAKEYYQQASRIYLATDADNAGHALAEELARRIGRERCWQVTWPRKSETTKELCKDANEVLIRFGRQALKEAIEGAELYPIQGLFRCQRLYDVTDAYYICQLGTELGGPTGWAGLDELYRQTSGPSEHLGGLSNEVSAGFLSGGIGEASFEADKTGDRAMGLTPAEDTGEAVVSKVIRADKRHIFFDLRCNNRGQFLRISEVIGSDRSAIIVPVSALEQFHDVLGHFVDITRTQGLAAASGANVCTVAAAHRQNEN